MSNMNMVPQKNREEWQRITAMANRRRGYFYQGDGGEAMMPHTICLAVNNYCFMRCAMCDVGQAIKDKGLRDEHMFFFQRQTGSEKAHFMPMEQIRKLVDEVSSYPDKPIIRANFLEPLIRDDICDIAELVRSRGLDFYIISNGYLLPKRAKGLIEAGARCIRISMDGPREVHNEVRGLPDSFDRSIEGLRILLEERERRGGEYPLIGVALTISNYNIGRAHV